MPEFKVCANGHPLPLWWMRDFCLRCDYEVGLAKLKAISEALRPGSFPEYAVTQTVTQDGVTQEKTCQVCNGLFLVRGKVCNACRQKAYRERSQ